MKQLFLLSILFLSAIVGMAQNTKETYVEVLYFHGKQRCVTCKAIEKYSKEVVFSDMAALAKKGKVKFRVIDISTEEGEKMAKNYRVSWSSLYVNKWKDGKEIRNDMTRFSFSNARNNTAEFKTKLKEKVVELLK